ncbi:MAG TPA: hypothetical protein PKG56_00135 [Chitinophagaceae bacterium]|nr:hypothetical protein [Chitinophagaceae bacterium]
MGTWKTRKLKKELSGRRNSTASTKAGKYLAFPPPTGWLGGRPEDNGYKRGTRK